MKTNDVKRAAQLLETREQIDDLRSHMTDDRLFKMFIGGTGTDDGTMYGEVSLTLEIGTLILDELEHTIADELRDLDVE